MRGMLEGWARDFTHATRSLLRAPVFTLVTVATLALAIGSNTAIFSVVKPVLLEPLPFAHADRLVYIAGAAPGTDLPDEVGLPDELYFEYRESVPAIEDIGVYGTGSSTTSAEGQTEQLFLTRATPALFSTLGARPLLGRLPADTDDDRVVVISHWMWRTWFGADSAVIGRSYDFARATRTVIGVMPPEFRFPDERVAFWVPLPLRAAQATAGGGFGLRAVARLAPDMDHERLAAQLAPLPRRVQQRLGGPAPYVRIMERYRPTVASLNEHLVGNVARPLWVILGTVAIIFLIACANVANLFTVRAEGRQRDLAVRRALGAGRASLIRSQMSEALLLAGAGGGIGALIAWAGVPLLVRVAPDAVSGGFGGAPIPRLESAGLDLTTLLFAVGVSIVAACAFGLAPAIRFSGVPLLGTLRQAGRGVIGRSHVTRNALVVLQTACALVLLVGSALLVRSFWQLSRVDAGYDTDNIFTFQIAPTRPELNDRASVSRFLYAFMDRLDALPGVDRVGFVTTLPLDEGAGDVFITTPQLQASGGEAPRVRFAGAGGAYFQAMGIELVRGRYFERIEEETGLPNVLISRSAANLLFPGQDPLGERVKPATGDEQWHTIVGVVEDVILDDLRRTTPEPMVYLPAVSLSPAFVLRSARAHQLAPEVRAVIREIMPESPMYRIFTMKQLAENTMASLSFTMIMLGVAAALALILGAVGLYGVLSYVVSQRTREIGIRMALGAEAGTLRRMVVAQGARTTLIGVVLGLGAALLLTDLLETMLFGIGAIDLLTFTTMSAVMIGVALLASYIPARRASAMDPMQSLRAE